MDNTVAWVIIIVILLLWNGGIEGIFSQDLLRERRKPQGRRRVRSVTQGREADGPVAVDANGLRRVQPHFSGAGHSICTAHPSCGPVTGTGYSGHGHGPNPSTGQWCWHFDEWWLGRPDEAAPEGSDLAARRAQQAEVNGGDPFAHKVYSTAKGVAPAHAGATETAMDDQRVPEDDYTDEVRAGFAILRSRGIEIPDDPVILILPEGLVDIASDPDLIPWPPDAEHGAS